MRINTILIRDDDEQKQQTESGIPEKRWFIAFHSVLNQRITQQNYIRKMLMCQNQEDKLRFTIEQRIHREDAKTLNIREAVRSSTFLFD